LVIFLGDSVYDNPVYYVLLYFYSRTDFSLCRGAEW
jgi:hypothetical protein